VLKRRKLPGVVRVTPTRILGIPIIFVELYSQTQTKVGDRRRNIKVFLGGKERKGTKSTGTTTQNRTH